MSKKTELSRRKFLQYTGVVTGAAAIAGPVVSVAAQDTSSQADHATKATPILRGRMFFTNDLEFSTLSAAAERIFPKDENGPGAVELAVPYFIDNQLAGAYGYNAREYTAGPHFPGAPTQGYQTPLLRREMFKQGLKALNDAAHKEFNKDFQRLQGEEQDKILGLCESGKLQTEGFPPDYFFSQLREAVLAGVYSDPIYNGNNNMDGWRMKDYPGAQMAYSNIMNSDKFEKIDPQSLADMQ